MTERLCLGCGQPLDGEGRADRRYHDMSCRKAAYRRRQREARAASPDEVGLGGITPQTSAAPPLDPEAVVAQALGETNLLIPVVRAARNGSWRAAAWLLERKYPERWARGAEHEPPAEEQSAVVARILSLVPPPSA